jgi:hypothetical protein
MSLRIEKYRKGTKLSSIYPDSYFVDILIDSCPSDAKLKRINPYEWEILIFRWECRLFILDKPCPTCGDLMLCRPENSMYMCQNGCRARHKTSIGKSDTGVDCIVNLDSLPLSTHDLSSGAEDQEQDTGDSKMLQHLKSLCELVDKSKEDKKQTTLSKVYFK